MNSIKKVAIAVNLSGPLPEVFKTLQNFEFLNNCEIHLIHSFLTLQYAVGLGETALVYPLEADRKVIEESALATLTSLEKKLLPTSFAGKIIVRCLFSEDPKSAFCSYLKEKEIDLVVAAARNKRGLFESSFTRYVSKHSEANILILKEK